MLSSHLVFRQLGEHSSPPRVDLSHIIPHSIQYLILSNQPHLPQMFSISMEIHLHNCSHSPGELTTIKIILALLLLFWSDSSLKSSSYWGRHKCCDADAQKKKITSHHITYTKQSADRSDSACIFLHLMSLSPNQLDQLMSC